MIETSIVITHKNNYETLESSLQSIIDNIDETFEIVIVDGGSDQDCLNLFNPFLDQRVRLFKSVNLSRGKARQIGSELSKGKYLIHHIDLDDEYFARFRRYVDDYKRLKRITRKPYLRGNGVCVTTRYYSLKEPYLDLNRCEDDHLWRRILSKNEMIVLDNPIIKRELKEKTLIQNLKRTYKNLFCKFSYGVSYPSFLKYCLKNLSLKNAYQLIFSPIAYIKARFNRVEPLPEECRSYDYLDRKMVKQTYSKIVAKYDPHFYKPPFSKWFNFIPTFHTVKVRPIKPLFKRTFRFIKHLRNY